VVGPRFFKALRGPLPHIRLMPTGGVDLTTAAAFLKAGACCLGVGGQLVEPDAVAKRDFGRIRSWRKQYVTIVKQVREGRVSCIAGGTGRKPSIGEQGLDVSFRVEDSRSSSFSPTPRIHGQAKLLLDAEDGAALAVPSSLARTMPVQWTDFLKCSPGRWRFGRWWRRGPAHLVGRSGNVLADGAVDFSRAPS